MPQLPFITFEGSEGSGKSTQADRLASRFHRCGVPYILTREPGGTPIGESIRELLQFAPHNSDMTSETELLLFEASRSQLVREKIKPALERGICVIADRFFDSTTVYQGAARKLDREIIERLNAFAVGDCVPDITFVLHVDAATAQSRMQRQLRKADRMEQQPAEFYERVREGYRDLAAHIPKRVMLINGSRDPDEIERDLGKIVLAFSFAGEGIGRLKMAFARTTAFEFLRRAYEQNRLAHAHLISGPPASGKGVLAAELASLVNGTAIKDVFSAKARDIFIARPESKSRRIVTAQIRALEHALQMRAADGRRKVAIIPDADRLQTEAANAFLKTLEEPPNGSLLLLLSAVPEALPETILSRCIAIPLASDREIQSNKEAEKLMKLLQQASRQTTWSIQFAYRLAQEFQQLLRAIREEVKRETDEALKREQARYKDATDGAWLDEREEYYKALTESLYLQRRAALLEILFAWWTDVLRANTAVVQRDLPAAKQETAALACRFNNTEILKRIRVLEELRDHLGRNIHESLATEVAFLAIFVA